MADTLYARRTGAEWCILRDLAALNTDRLTGLHGADSHFEVTLRHTPAPLVDGEIVADHRLRIGFPVHYPAVPMTLHLLRPVLHPNVHPRTGFVCLWKEHRVGNNLEHALHKLVAMLVGSLWNPDPVHVMQPAALDRMGFGKTVPLSGLTHPPQSFVARPRRSRLS